MRIEDRKSKDASLVMTRSSILDLRSSIFLSDFSEEDCMTATELLKNDHQKAVSLIGELEAADRQVGTVQTNTDAFNHLNELLMMHTVIEEEVFYPAMKEFD